MNTLHLLFPPVFGFLPVIVWGVAGLAGLAGITWFGAKAIDDTAEAVDKVTDATTKLGVFAIGAWLIYMKLKKKRSK